VKTEAVDLDPKFSAFLEAAPDAIVIVDVGGVIVAVKAPISRNAALQD